MRRIVVAGASGMIGSPLVRELRAAGNDVGLLVRREPRAGEIRWDPAAGQLDPAALEGADAVICLSGASVGRIPWTSAYRRELVASRVDPTRLLAETMAGMSSPPPVFLSGSAVGIYGDRPRVRLDDESPRGEGFFPDLVLAWEQASRLAPAATRVVNLRTAVVVARRGGLEPVRLLTSFGLGARFASGRAYWPWISLDDEVRAIIHLLSSSLRGPVVLAGPTPATSDEITRQYAYRLHRWRLLRVPGFAIRLALGDAGQNLLLNDVQVVPAKLEDDGFEWRHRTVDEAIAASLA